MSNPVNDPNKKLHWFLLSYMVPAPGQWQPVSFYGSYTNRVLTIPALNALREANRLPDSAVLMHATYLGLQSTHKMRGTSDKVQPTNVSEAYRQGMISAHLHKSAQGEPANPYEPLAGESQEAMTKANEWAEGFAEGVRQIAMLAQLNPAPVV